MRLTLKIRNVMREPDIQREKEDSQTEKHQCRLNKGVQSRVESKLGTCGKISDYV